VARAIVGPHKRRRTVGKDVKRGPRWNLADPVDRARIAGILLVVCQRLVLLELGVLLRIFHVDCAYGEPSTKHPFLPGMPSQSNPRHEVIVVTTAESAGGMNQATYSSCERVGRLRIKICSLTKLRAKRALIGVPDPKIERQGRRDFPVVLEVE